MKFAVSDSGLSSSKVFLYESGGAIAKVSECEKLQLAIVSQVVG